MGNTDSALKKAIEWIASEMTVNSGANRLALIDQASTRFHLSPLQPEHLYRHFAAPTS
jgi:hypothetical protein